MSGSVNPDGGPGNLFDGLDDPTPPAFGNDLLPGVVQRGHRLRQQRRMAYAVGSTCVGVLIAGAAVGVAASGNHSNGPGITPLSPKPSHHHTKKAHHHTESPGASAGGSQPGGTGSGGKHHHPTCTSPTPTDTATPTPTPTDTGSPSVEPTGAPSAPPDDGTAPPAAVNTPCDSPTPTESSTESPEPTYPSLPLISDEPQASSERYDGIR